MVAVASRLSAHVAPGFMLLIECYTPTFAPVVLAEVISCSPFAARCLLYATPLILNDNLLLTATSFPLAARFLFGSCLSLVGPFLIASPAPLTAGWHNAYCMPLAITFWHVTGSPFAFFFFDSWLTNNRALLVVSSQRFAACYSHP